jgi:hypothetical protein
VISSCYCGKDASNSVHIINPARGPGVDILKFSAEDLQGNPVTQVNVMEHLLVVAQVIYTLPAGSTLTVSINNNPASYTQQQAALPQANGWVQISQTTVQGSTDFSGIMTFHGVAPVNATAVWRWNLRLEAVAPDGQVAPDGAVFSLAVTEPATPWAAFDHDQSTLSYVQPGHNLLVTMVGSYVFPAAYTGSLTIEIRMSSGAAIPGGAPQEIPNLNGKEDSVKPSY